MNYSYYLRTTLILIAIISFYIWIRWVTKTKVAELKKAGKYDEKRAEHTGIVLNFLVGLIFITIMLFNWNSIPPGNELIAVLFIVFGLGYVFYGVYKWHRLRRRSN